MDISKKTTSHKETFILITSAFIAGLCSIIYELLISTASSYFLGDSIKQFSITIGLYMAAMGIGSYISRLINKNLLSTFIALEIILGFLGGISIPVLYFSYAYTDAYYPIMVLMVLSIGTLIGLEVPLLTRIMEKYYSLKFNISNILSVDYLGALIATLVFPFILLPFLGTFRSSLFFGIINMGIGFINLWCFADKLRINERRRYTFASITVCVFLISLFFSSHFLLRNWSNSLYEDQILLSKQSKFQKLVLTKDKEDIRLFLDGNLQFSSIDEYRYHEALVHIPLGAASHRNNILILGGGDGMAAREVLKYSDVESVYVVDLDPAVTNLSRDDRHIKALNQRSLDNNRVHVVNQDAFVFLEETQDLFDVIIADLPDPNNVSLARLYSKEFFKLVSSRLSKTGIFVTQATSPYFASKAFWSIHNTIKAAGFHKVYPYHVYVPSFGDWGFVVASDMLFHPNKVKVSVPTKYIEDKIVESFFIFEKDLINRSSEYSTLDDPIVLNYYLDGWRYWK